MNCPHLFGSMIYYVSYKDIKKVVANLKKIYGAVTLEEAEKNQQAFAETWRKQYPSYVKSRAENRPLSTFFESLHAATGQFFELSLYYFLIYLYNFLGHGL